MPSATIFFPEAKGPLDPSVPRTVGSAEAMVTPLIVLTEMSARSLYQLIQVVLEKGSQKWLLLLLLSLSVLSVKFPHGLNMAHLQLNTPMY